MAVTTTMPLRFLPLSFKVPTTRSGHTSASTSLPLLSSSSASLTPRRRRLQGWYRYTGGGNGHTGHTRLRTCRLSCTALSLSSSRPSSSSAESSHANVATGRMGTARSLVTTRHRRNQNQQKQRRRIHCDCVPPTVDQEADEETLPPTQTQTSSNETPRASNPNKASRKSGEHAGFNKPDSSLTA